MSAMWQEADLVLEEDFVDALVAMVRSLPLGDIWQAAPALPPPQRRGGRPGGSDAPSPSEQALQVRASVWRPVCMMQPVTGMQVRPRYERNMDVMICLQRSQRCTCSRPDTYLLPSQSLSWPCVSMQQALLCPPPVRQPGGPAASASRRWYFERLELQAMRCNLTVIPRPPGARDQARPLQLGSFVNTHHDNTAAFRYMRAL